MACGSTGRPIEFILLSVHDLQVFRAFDLALPPGARLYADKNYNDYAWEDFLHEAAIEFRPLRKDRSRRPHPP